MKEHTVNEVPIIANMRKFEIVRSGPQAIAVSSVSFIVSVLSVVNCAMY